jgi:hypothetical protein
MKTLGCFDEDMLVVYRVVGEGSCDDVTVTTLPNANFTLPLIIFKADKQRRNWRTFRIMYAETQVIRSESERAHDN